MRFVLILLLYGGIQIYFVAKAIRAFDAAAWGWVLALAWAGLMTIGPLLQWRLERRPDRHVLAVGSAWIVFGWMGFSFLFFWFGLVMDAYGWGARLAALPMLAARPAFVLLVWLTWVVWVLGFISARHPRVERLTIYSDKIPPGPGLRIAQISDVHLGILIGRQRLDRILQQLTALQPDILVSTGDLVDAEAHHLNDLSARLAAYQPRYGKFAITGNHERFAGLEHALDFHVRAGFKLLRGETVEVAGGIALAGVDDPAVRASKTDEARMLAAIPAGRFVVLLKHQPVIDPQSRFDLQLSGHTHNGQIFPFNLLVKTVYPLIAGRYDLPDGRQLYVSRGTGTWGPPIRSLSPAEITLIELKSA